jgi:hypothetical protein
VNGTMMRMSRSGKPCAWTAEVKAAIMKTQTASDLGIMLPSPVSD